MSQPLYIAKGLEKLVSHIEPPHSIDDYFRHPASAIGGTVMTSMGNRSRGLVTPAYQAIQYESKLLDRLNWAAIQNRPFVEGQISFQKHNNVASVVMRLCNAPKVGEEMIVLESSAIYDVSLRAKHIDTFEDVVSAISAYPELSVSGLRNGYIFTNAQPRNNGNWQISQAEDPLAVAEIVNEAVFHRIDFVSI
jgi:hypothetical protein